MGKLAGIKHVAMNLLQEDDLNLTDNIIDSLHSHLEQRQIEDPFSFARELECFGVLQFAVSDIMALVRHRIAQLQRVRCVLAAFDNLRHVSKSFSLVFTLSLNVTPFFVTGSLSCLCVSLAFEHQLFHAHTELEADSLLSRLVVIVSHLEFCLALHTNTASPHSLCHCWQIYKSFGGVTWLTGVAHERPDW